MTTELWMKSGEAIQFLGGIFMVITYIPQILMLLRTKSAENQSKTFWILLIISLSTFTYNAVLLYIFKGALSVLVTQALNLILALIILALLIKYSKKGRK